MWTNLNLELTIKTINIMGKRLKSQQNLMRRLKCLLVSFALLMPMGTWAEEYQLWVGQTQVTSENAADVLADGKVSFSVTDDPATGGQINVLTLNGATITSGSIECGLDNLTIQLKGSNTVDNSIYYNGQLEGSTLTFTKDETETAVCKLVIGNSTSQAAAIYGFSSLNYGSGMSLSAAYPTEYSSGGLSNKTVSTNLEYMKQATITSATVYPVWYNGEQVTSENADNLSNTDTPQVYFDIQTGTLTFDHSEQEYLGYAVAFDMPIVLNVNLVGGNSITLSESATAFKFYNENAGLKFTTNVDNPGGLTVSSDGTFVDGMEIGTLSYDNGLELNEGNGGYTIAKVYDIWIADTQVTSQNRTNVLRDQGTVQFDGNNTLILNGASLSSVTLGTENSWVKNGLTIYLKGNNNIEEREQDGLVYQGQGASVPLTFVTGDVKPGTLTLSYSDQPLVGFTPTFLNNLTETLNTESHTLTVAVGIEPFVTHDEETETVDGDSGDGIGEDIENIGESESPSSQSVIVNKILYTLSDNDGYLLDGSDKVVALNTSSSVPNALPGTEDFADNFKGMTILIPAGSGEIVVKVLTAGEGVLNIQIGNQTPVQFSGLTEFTDCTVPYALTEPTYVYIYKTGPAGTPVAASRRAPGRKETTTIEIKGLSVRASMVVASPAPSMSPKNLSQALINSNTDGNHVVISDPEINGLGDGAFLGLNGKTITYVDLSGTSIKGVEVDRTSGVFSDVPENAFIYMPVGNTVKAETKNVIIGAVCNNMELAEVSLFDISKDFIAVEATQTRDYSLLLDKNCTVYLPFAIDAETVKSLGKFYELSAVADGKVTMETVTATKANTPYMFKPGANTISVKMAEVKKPADSFPKKGSATFIGTYIQKSIVSGTDNYYCFKADDGKFVRVTGTTMTVNPFRAYIEVKGAALGRSLDIDTGDGATAIKNVKVGTDDNVYYDMQGRRVLYPKKGLYIMNGKKVIIK